MIRYCELKQWSIKIYNIIWGERSAIGTGKLLPAAQSSNTYLVTGISPVVPK